MEKIEEKPTPSKVDQYAVAHDTVRDDSNGDIYVTADDTNWRGAFLDTLRSFDNYLDMDALVHTKAALASILERTYYSYRTEDKGAFDLGIDLQILLKDQEIPAPLNTSYTVDDVPGKRQPGLEESIAATLERFNFIEDFENTFGEKIDGIIVGGSMSYGPFFNVRDGNDNSDIDAIMVMNDSFFDSSEWSGLRDSSILTAEDKEIFLKRKTIFEEMYLQGEAQVLSQRFHAEGSEFNMSAHIMPRDIFEGVYCGQLANDMSVNQDTVTTLRDYKPKKFERLKCDHQGFKGGSVDYVLPEQEPVDSGFIATIPAYLINESQYYPGLYQCLLLPSALVAFDKSSHTTRVTTQFARLVDERLDTEKALDPAASLLNAYPRKAILAPGRYAN